MYSVMVNTTIDHYKHEKQAILEKLPTTFPGMYDRSASKEAAGYRNPATQAAANALSALVNTRPHMGLDDTLVDGTAVDHMVRAFAGGDHHASETDLSVVIQLRDAVARTIEDDASASAEAWAEISELVGPATLRRVFTPEGVTLQLSAGDPVVAGIAESIHAIVEADSWSRLRLCGNHLCNSAFFDSTRSRTQKWHSDETCGNRARVSAHRARTRKVEDE